MANGHNLFISYDLKSPEKNYAALSNEIKKLGGWAKPNLSFWFVDSTYTAEQAAKLLRPFIDNDDKLFVVDVRSNTAAWYNVDPVVDKYVKANWNY